MQVIFIAVLFAFVVGSATALSTQQFKEIVEPVAKKCKGEVEGATDKDVENVVHREELGTRSGKCLQYCVYEKLGGMRDGHIVGHDEALAVLHRIYDGDFEKLENATAKIEHCGVQVLESDLADGCEIADRVQQCFRKLH